MAHEEQIAEAQAKIRELERELRRIEEAINNWKTVFDTYQKLDGKTPSPLDTSLRPLDAIRKILADHPGGLTPRQIRDQLIESGIDVSAWKFPMANIHTLIKNGKDIEMVPRGGAKYYRLKEGVSE